MIKLKYFCADGFIIKEGVLTELNLQLKYLKIVKDKIDFNDIYFIEKV